MSITENLKQIKQALPERVELVAVSKYHPNEAILAAYNVGQRIFGENKVQELLQKYESLPKDIEWHFIGHLQTNKVKYIAPFVSMIEGVDSFRLLAEINKQAIKSNRKINCLLQIHIAQEETKFGFDMDECRALLASDEFKNLKNVQICGLMGMATNTDDEAQIKHEFHQLATLFNEVKQTWFADDANFNELSMGMSDDYKIAIECGSTLIRIGSMIFGVRNYN